MRGLLQSVRSLREVFHSPNLRKLNAAWLASISGDWAFLIGLAVFAYRAGGATAVGLVTAIRMLPAAAAAPLAGIFADRGRREHVMIASDLVRASAAAGAGAAVALHAPVGFVYALAALVAVASTAVRPAQLALLPWLTRTPEELTAANASYSVIESVATLLGPVLGGLLLTGSTITTLFFVVAGGFLISALLISRLETERRPVDATGLRPQHVVRDALSGFTWIARSRSPRLLASLFSAQTLVRGALNVMIVVSALQLMRLGKPGIGYLTSAIGAGGLLGSITTLALMRERRLSSSFAVGIALWGLPIAVIGLWPHPAPALVLLAMVGVGNTLVDVAGNTLLQRTVPDEVLARVFGVLESLVMATIGIGALLAPVLISGLGIRGALILFGVFLPLLAGVAWKRLATVETETVPPVRELAVLRSIPLFAPLSLPTMERLASRLFPVPAPAGGIIIREGDVGDRFYAVVGGEVLVSTDGRPIATLGPGDYFGEIALLRDVPRTATVTAIGDVELFALERDDFISAVTGHRVSTATADETITERLGGLSTLSSS